jgi:osmotically-inducible protein OsmY
MARKLAFTLLLFSVPWLSGQQQQPRDPMVPAASAQAAPAVSGEARPQDGEMQPLREDNQAENEEIESNLSSVLGDDPILTDVDVDVEVDDYSVTLTGTAQSQWQHRRILQLAAPYRQYRRIVDRVTVQ